MTSSSASNAPGKAIRTALTEHELCETIRALDLISAEDESCDVNIEEDARTAKQSALRKLRLALKNLRAVTHGNSGPGKSLDSKDAKLVALVTLVRACDELTKAMNGMRRGSKRRQVEYEQALQRVATDWIGAPLTREELAAFQ
jgi:hypothetical protein